MDKKRVLLTAIIGFFIIVSIILVVKTRSQAIIRVNPAFREYISGFTSGVVSTESTIKVRLTQDMADSSMFEKAVDKDLFDISPSVKGKAYWIDTRTVEFRPDAKLPYGKLFTVKFYLSELMQVPDSMSVFMFQFQTSQQAFEVEIKNHTAYNSKDPSKEKITGVIHTADAASPDDIQKVIGATQEGKNLNVTVNAESGNTEFSFVVDSVKRGEKESTVIVNWNGKTIEAASNGSSEVVIPSVNDFCITGHTVVQEPEQYVLLQFSDPLLEDQDLRGLIRIGENEASEQLMSELRDALNLALPGTETMPDVVIDQSYGLNFMIEGNEVRIYPQQEMSGTQLISVDASVKNTSGKELGKKFSDSISFEDVKPDLRLVGEGVILPSTNGLIFPFEAINLKAVDVKILKVYENNVAQFLQVNDLKGQRELSRVGKVVLKKTIQLNSIQSNVMNYAKWNRYFLDLSDLINAEPGAIYRVTITAKKSYSLYQCDSDEEDEDGLEGNFDDADQEQTTEDWFYYNDYYDEYYYDDYDYYYYDWYEREDPCSESYYNSLKVSRNVLATDIGLIAKTGSSGDLNIFATNLVTAQPMSGVSIEVLDYQSQMLYKKETNGSGLAAFELKKIPYLIVAKKGSQRSYLKLTGGSALSLSMFDVGGEAVRKGVKGFLYGERGVWRPGDSIFLTFILEDKLDVLPPEVPVVFDLVNPRGQKVQHLVKTSSVNGFYDFSTATDPGALTGNWTAQVRVGSSLFTKSLRIETIKPNRLKIKLDFGGDKIFAGENKPGSLEVKWLHGATARNLRTDVTMVLNKTTTLFEKYSSYVFDDPSKRFYSETYTVFSGNIDNEGKAVVDPGLNVQKSSPGMLKAHFETRVFEEGGEFSVDRFSINYYPYKTFVGLDVPEGEYYDNMLYTGTSQVFKVVNLTPDGKPAPNTKLKVDIYKVEWRWWWDNYGDDLADFVRSSYNEPYQTFDITTSGGKSQFNLNIPDADWGRYFVRITDTENGHSTGRVVYFDWPGWRNRKFDNKEAASMLVFTADKDKYEVGEEVTLTIPSGKGARALICLETGSKLLESFWVDTEEEHTQFKFTITEEMAPNIYANVTLIQPHDQTANDLPIRLYGAIPIFIDDPNTHLRPEIAVADVLKPEENASITVKEENGKAMTYTVAVVDEGLLDLTSFKTPDPWKNFYSREALGVKTWDIYDYVMGAYGGKLERILSIGGDGEEDGQGGGKNRANRFKPMVKFFGPFALGKGQSHTYNFKMPQYIGSVRIMVIAGQDGAYGSAEKTVAVRKPLMLLATLPRVVGPGESVSLPVSVFAMEKKIKNVQVKVTTNEFFTLEDQSLKTVTFSEPGDDLVNFRLKVNDATGVGKVKVMANCGNEYAYYEIEIDVRNPNPEVTEVIEGVIKPGQNWTTAYMPVGMKGSNIGTIELYTIPPMNLQKRLQYLIAYPYGCVEQTTSAAFPQLYLADLTDLTEKDKARIERNVKAAIRKIQSFQTPSGGVSYWPGSAESDEWASCYAGHFLIEAKEKGYNVSSSFLKKWLSFQKRKALAWTPDYMKLYYQYDHVQAYRLYTLALAKQPELGSMNLLKEQKNLSTQARWRLAAAYQLAGQTGIAKQITNNAPTVIKTYKEMYFTYGSDDRDRAMILEALSLLQMHTRAAPLAKQLAEELSKDRWMSTQTTAYALLAISKYVASSGTSSSIDVTYSLNKGGDVKKTSGRPATSIDMALKGAPVKGKIKIRNNGKSLLYARVVLQGVPAAGDDKPYDNNLKIEVVYKSLKGDKIDPSKLPQGTDFIAEVTLTNPGLMGYYYNLALSHIFPSGWEIHNTRMDTYYGRIQMSAYDYQDIRDDRVYTFFSLASNTSKTYKVLLNASYLGRFYLPSVNCEAMYDNSIAARTKGQWVEVVPYNDTEMAKK